MAFAEKLIAVRRAHHLTQEQLAAKLFVTRQAVSRWERGEVTPGIDMMKLIAAVTDEPLSHLLEMPEHYCQSCGMILTPDDCGTDAAGAATDHYCKWCYDHGQYTYETTMEAMIEDCAPRLAQNTGMSLDEAVSLMGAVLPRQKRCTFADRPPSLPRRRAPILTPPIPHCAIPHALSADTPVCRSTVSPTPAGALLASSIRRPTRNRPPSTPRISCSPRPQASCCTCLPRILPKSFIHLRRICPKACACSPAT